MKYFYWCYVNYEDCDPTIWMYNPYEELEYQYDMYNDFTTAPIRFKKWVKESGNLKLKILKAESLEEAIDILRKQYPEIRL